MNKRQKIEKISVVFVLFEKFECQTKIGKKKNDDDVLSRIKGVVKKYVVLKKKEVLLRKMFVWIKDDQDSVTRPKGENWKKIGLG